MLKDASLVQPMNRVTIVGLGLIGGSFALGLKAHGLCNEIVGCSRSQSTLDKGLQLGVIDRAEPDILKAVAGADLVMLAAPIGSTETLLRAMAPALDGSAVVTDAGSVKGNVVAAAKAVFGKVPNWFVPGHPIAGSERSGVEAAKVDLYQNHKVILTPLPDTDPDALNLVQHAWSGIGAEVLTMSVEQHDSVLAATSHLPHLLAFSLVDTLAKEDENQEIFRYAAGGFRDFTRIASSDPTMWHDIFIANQQSILDVIGHFSRGLEVFKAAVEQQDSQAMLGIMTRAKVARDHFTKMLAKRAYSKTMTEKNVVFTAHRGGEVKGSIRVPGDKSISHRSIMMGSLADGVTEVFGFLEGEDSLATLQSFRDLGVTIEGPNNGHVKVYGVGIHGLLPPHGPLYLGNSGTSMRLLAGLLSAQKFDVELTGDESLSRRPMGRVTKPLAMMGAKVDCREDGTPPLKIKGGQPLKGIHYDMPMASAQVKSCVLLAGLYAEGVTSVTEPAPTRDHTERMLRGFGYPVTTEGNKITLVGGGSLKGTTIDVPADISSAAFFMVAASITPGADLTLQHVGINPTRVGVINILNAMGGNLEVLNRREVGGEPVADIRIQHAKLKGIHIPEDQVPLAIDEFPVLFVAAACAEGTTVLTGAEELRVKESDRIQVMADGLQALGVKADPTPDGIVIEGGAYGGGTVESHGDHRIAMSFAVAALRAGGNITINNCANVATSFPNFVELSRKVGMKLDVAEVGESNG
ncbi:bifunctional prephenate dehydrogenase/3-phosphoshikimate 1-carboxyvinyltransferase [Ketobacter alkanivorans]|uniref:3-phosphoshikimate 1-carboxyvinyltransferase n=2 Tax=Ketobacter alkanivorans TaxID=1917421 RepID=A0A2K9LH53_9GAMM|nr:bifunctional prephenate dehydrogenase/3-phosphoshikimate 1-carboxyvinyltransferase [Ketobacter alkanivorans]